VSALRVLVTEPIMGRFEEVLTRSRTAPPSRSETGTPASLPWMSSAATSNGESTRSAVEEVITMPPMP